jgi:hypothetical protein
MIMIFVDLVILLNLEPTVPNYDIFEFLETVPFFRFSFMLLLLIWLVGEGFNSNSMH